ncbi:MAG: hypothetical protein JSR27_05250 [Proteobacteria bacterium]|nr:hypothetical protein [Pseudomonadota bacterium]
MRKSSIIPCVRTFAIVLTLALLAACGGRNAITHGTSDIMVADAPTTFDLTVSADKDSQFDYEGATLSREDLAGHIRYLAEIGKPVHTILLQAGEKQKIKDTHLAALAGICRDLKITGYVRDDDGRLKVIQVVE